MCELALYTHNTVEKSTKVSVGRNPYDLATCRESCWFPSKHKLLFADRGMTTLQASRGLSPSAAEGELEQRTDKGVCC